MSFRILWWERAWPITRVLCSIACVLRVVCPLSCLKKGGFLQGRLVAEHSIVNEVVCDDIAWAQGAKYRDKKTKLQKHRSGIMQIVQKEYINRSMSRGAKREQEFSNISLYSACSSLLPSSHLANLDYPQICIAKCTAAASPLSFIYFITYCE